MQELTSLASPERLAELLKETEEELQRVQPRIDELERQVQELRDLRLSKQRLLTLKMSLSALLENFSDVGEVPVDREVVAGELGFTETKLYSYEELSTLKMFHPDDALKQVDQILKQKQSLNYEIFKAVVFRGGKATTEEIKAYLVEIGARQPQTGEGFEDVPLTEISSRTNYLVRKGVLLPAGRGSFYTPLGWQNPQ